ncbi:hypothetical protein G5I_00418 [Acromyrmex echinatior]|uniref:Uncharacterized protein n=1 Tax=Acromyrmex echinatior TaxID=103372 RepID=F4W4U3_ACREC|nr:hypothetical protein G5I_00418 [Acromyrmex echinatior]
MGMGGEENVAGPHRDEVLVKNDVRGGVSWNACIKVVIPSGLIGIYEFSRSLSGSSFQFCQIVIRRLRSSLADPNHSRDVEPKERIVAYVGRNNSIFNMQSKESEEILGLNLNRGLLINRGLNFSGMFFCPLPQRSLTVLTISNALLDLLSAHEEDSLSCSYQEVTTQGGRDVGNAPSVPLT